MTTVPEPAPSTVFANAAGNRVVRRLALVPDRTPIQLGGWLGRVDDPAPCPRRDFVVVEWEHDRALENVPQRPVLLPPALHVLVPHPAAVRGIA